MNEIEFQKDPLSPLEISGAICAKVLHDLSNMVGGIVGNAEYAADAAGESLQLKKAIQAITTSANSAGRLLGQCLPLQRSISGAAFGCDVNELAKRIAAANAYAPDWRVNVSSNLGGQVQAQGRWLIGAVWQIVRETRVDKGELDFLCGPALFPVVWRGPNLAGTRPSAFFQINLRYRAEEPLITTENPAGPDKPGLFAACELIRIAKGQVQCRANPPARQEISILLPLS